MSPLHCPNLSFFGKYNPESITDLKYNSYFCMLMYNYLFIPLYYDHHGYIICYIKDYIYQRKTVYV